MLSVYLRIFFFLMLRPEFYQPRSHQKVRADDGDDADPVLERHAVDGVEEVVRDVGESFPCCEDEGGDG